MNCRSDFLSAQKSANVSRMEERTSGRRRFHVLQRDYCVCQRLEWKVAFWRGAGLCLCEVRKRLISSHLPKPTSLLSTCLPNNRPRKNVREIRGYGSLVIEIRINFAFIWFNLLSLRWRGLYNKSCKD